MVATLDAAARPHRQRRAAHAADRPALGDRPARPGPARPPRRATWPAPAAAPRATSTATSPRSWRPRVAGVRPDRGRLAHRRARRPRATVAYSPEARERFALLAAELRRAARARRRAAARPGPPDHRRHRHRRRAGVVGQPGRARPAATTSTCSSRRSRSSRPSTATSTLPALLAYLRGRGRVRHRASTSPPRPRPTRSSCSPSTGPRASSGTSCSWSASAKQVPRHRGRAAWTDRRRRCCRSRCAATPATCRRWPGARAGRLDAVRRGVKAARGASRSSGSATSRSPGPGTCSSSRRYCGGRRARSRSGPSPYQLTVRDACAGWGVDAETWRDKPARATPTRCARGRRGCPWPVEATPPRSSGAGRRGGACAAASTRRGRDDGRRRGRRRAGRARRGSPQWDAEHRAAARRRRGASRRRRGRRAAARQPVGDRAGAAARRPGRLRRASWPGRCRASPRPPPGSAPGSTPGSRATFGQQQTPRPRRAARPRRRRDRRRRRPARADRGVRGRAVRRPAPHAVEAPFALVLAGQVVRGRIDAVYATDATASSSSTGRPTAQTADPLQLAIYRVAWAELTGRRPCAGPRRVLLRAHRRGSPPPPCFCGLAQHLVLHDTPTAPTDEH